ncbi:hypothetical protein PTTG_25623 [Puccinia triticina 1-1 BBBD Race 1]|uniref:Uncharacterized protein n=2 Tax=Puccinia triticina TaxID=208348 RepID=A0A180H1R3_PUCT1|nr:uncharacterized protein PtA15_2A908 [Puccinia triticina]OAV98714.1 hypothetical protein PTTG_25623 [Puccinia triticina 1-1 BBBD Race 1]WAQ82591.1 hypothetical protein PtA15_2A908 [Puccinia triticina]
MSSFASISEYLKWLVLLAPMVVATSDVSRCTWTVSWAEDGSMREGAQEVCEGLTVAQVVEISLGISIGTLLLSGVVALVYRRFRRQNPPPFRRVSATAWPITRHSRRPVFQPLGTPAAESVCDLKPPEKAVYHI